MKTTFMFLLSLTLLSQLISCSSRKFVKEEVCSPSSLAYLKATKGREKGPQMTHALERQLIASKEEMQNCYNEFYARTGMSEFQTCLVVGVDVTGMMDFYHFSSQDIHSDQKFIQCAVRVTKRIPWWQYGTNYTVLQTYNFEGK
jgi:hypothetical protein